MSVRFVDPAWELTRALAKVGGRRTVMPAVRDAHGDFINGYRGSHATSQDAPDGPWALFLTDANQGFRFVVFDLDAKAGNPLADERRLTAWLRESGISYLVCASGPSGGRHVWVALSEPVELELVKTLARRARLLLPSLDIQPLTNDTTGCVRPPLSPHRDGGRSEPLGDPSVLLAPSTTRAQLAALDAFLADAGAELPAPNTARPRGVEVDEGGHFYLSGARRRLSARTTWLLAQPPAEDASATLAQVFLAAANARWRFEDVLQLARVHPALENARTMRVPGGRRPRGESGIRHVVSFAWYKAVLYAAANPAARQGDDETFPEREKTVVAALSAAQERANAMPGLWGADRLSRARRRARGSSSYRAVFDALCLYMAHAVSLEIEADTRRISADTSWGRTTVATALKTLESAGLIRQTKPAADEHAPSYTLSEQFSTEGYDRDRSQGRKPARAVSPARSELILELGTRLALPAHDVFAAPRSLGRTAGILYALLAHGGSATVDELTPRSGMPGHTVRRMLRRLRWHGLVELEHGRWAATGLDRDQVAEALGVAGYLETRRARYDVERAVWARWQLELVWMRKDHLAKRRRRPDPTSAMLPGQEAHERARYPRGPDHRGDHRTAHQLEWARRAA